MKGQISLEAVIIIGFVLLLMIPLLYVLFARVISVQDEFRTLEATRAVGTMASAVSTVGVIGPNGSTVIEITLPDNVVDVSIGGAHPREITIVLSTSLGEIDMVRMVPYNVTGNISINPGRQYVRITYSEDGLPIQVERSYA